MVVAGLEHAIELAQLAMEETGFGVFEDKVVKNLIATEFLYDCLKDKRTVGLISEDPERAIQEIAEPSSTTTSATRSHSSRSRTTAACGSGARPVVREPRRAGRLRRRGRGRVLRSQPAHEPAHAARRRAAGRGRLSTVARQPPSA